MESILFVVRGDETIPSCRFRAYQYADPLRKLGVEVDFFVEGRDRTPLHWARTTWRLLRAASDSYGAIVYQKRLQPERIRLLRRVNERVFFDFDDAMYVGHERRFSQTMRAAGRVIAGNALLAEEAMRCGGAKVTIVPTAVPVQAYREPPELDGPLRVSWVGTADNLRFLAPVLEALPALRTAGAGALLHVLTERPEEVPRIEGVVAERWSREAEVAAFSQCHLGVMPLADDPWCRGKCAAKALQYLSYGRPVICSPVGVNVDIFADESFGRLASDADQFRESLRFYHGSREAMVEAGRRGRRFVEERYNVERWAETLKDLLLSAA